MELDNDLIMRFAKITQFNNKKESTTVRGTVQLTDDDRPYIKIDGAEDGSKTPAETTVEISDGDRVIATVKDHSVIITGNKTNPSIGTKTAGALSSSITQTAEKIRTDVTNTVNGLKSSYEQTAEKIRTDVSNEVSGLKSSYEQTASDIKTRIENLNAVDSSAFTEFKQTVEGFYFTDENGTVWIDGGDVYAKNLKLTGAITWSDLSTSTKNTINGVADDAYDLAEAAEIIANEAYELAEEAISVAEAAELPSYIKSTYIDEARIESPEIIGGKFYAVGSDPDDSTTFSIMDDDGFYVYYNTATYDGENDYDRLLPKISLRTYSSGKDIRLMLGTKPL